VSFDDQPRGRPGALPVPSGADPGFALRARLHVMFVEKPMLRAAGNGTVVTLALLDGMLANLCERLRAVRVEKCAAKGFPTVFQGRFRSPLWCAAAYGVVPQRGKVVGQEETERPDASSSRLRRQAADPAHERYRGQGVRPRRASPVDP
jgi:hypothetical protein